ncbi:MAG: HAMP domain-containing histidine kinase [Oscillospiraceae bacterium]|nr:HAMP domain-containing histidine kinase [Oscillospiraceae bacterium]
MKTTFRRQFTTIAALLLFSLLFTGVSYRILMLRTLGESTRQELDADAAAVAALTEAYGSVGGLEENWDFRMSLSLISAVGDTQIQICDETGVVRLCSCDTFDCAHVGAVLPTELCEKIRAGDAYGSGSVDTLFTDKRFYTGKPLGENGTQGFVIASSQMTQSKAFIASADKLLVIAGVASLAISLLAATFLSRTQTKMLAHVADAARRFGHGETDVRVQPSPRCTREVRDLAQAFNTMADSLEQSERRRQEFIANVSHELKTPMTTIGGFVDGMLDGTIPQEKHPQYMQTVANEVRRLSRLVRNMLDISRLQAQGADVSRRSRFDVAEMVSDVLISFEQKINAKHLQVSVELPDKALFTKAERDGITQVLYNLVDNAVKFSQDGGLLALDVKVQGGKIVLSVRNTGKTIAPDELPHIFERFHKEDKSRSADREGWGLGLYIARTIIGAHGEDITAASADGVTTFRFTLPQVR